MKISRRDFLKLGVLGFGTMAFAPFKKQMGLFDDRMLVRVATNAISVHSQPDDESRIVGQWYRDDLLTVYETVTAKKPEYNPVWYRVWGGFVHRARMQRVQVLYNPIQNYFADDTRYLAEVTVPYSLPMRHSKFYGWEPIYPLYYESVHWVDGIREGPDGELWYSIFDELVSVPYYVPAHHLRMIPYEEFTPLSPEVDFLDKRVDVILSTQKLYAYEYDKVVFETTISSGLLQGNPNGIGLNTPIGKFNIREKMPSKHMGDGSLASDVSDTEVYELPGVPWTSFFTEAGHAFHGTYWHENYGVPMSHGCVNMRTHEAKWLFRWLRPVHNGPQLYRRGYGTEVNILYS